ncbi:MAG: hypothetical protein LBB56_01270 [Chitinispirillales bacterium]|jgi:hypothetical protein|nr:hypothetical protein [Chitinispirillales bacterium]
MSKKKFVFLIISAIIFMFIIAGFIIPHPNSLRRTNESIRESILEVTPIGMTKEGVLEIISSRHENGGFIANCQDINITGNGSIKAIIGNYGTIFSETTVVAYWRFNENGILIDIEIEKYTDAW